MVWNVVPGDGTEAIVTHATQGEMDGDRWTVAVSDLADTPIDVKQAAERSGYIPFFGQMMSARASDAVFLNAGNTAADLQRAHCETRLVTEQGIRAFAGALVAGHSFVFVEDRLVLDDSVPCQISKTFALQEGLAEGEFSRKASINVDQPLLVIAGPGYPIWGHWLLDFIPRLALAQAVLGCDLKDCLIPMPADTPSWVFGMVRFFCGVDDKRFLLYDKADQAVQTSATCYMPTFAHTDYFLHGSIINFYKRFVPNLPRNSSSKICVSRRQFSDSRSVSRKFLAQELFEQTAEEHGYLIIRPEEHSFRAQINIFANAGHVIGEFGSGMHNTIFSPAGTRVGQFVYPNYIQSRIAGLCCHESVFLIPDNQPQFDQPVVAELQVSESAIKEFFDVMDRSDHRTKPSTKKQLQESRNMQRFEVIQELLDLFENPNYLEIGVNTGNTFSKIKSNQKTAVDPKFLFEYNNSNEGNKLIEYYEVESDQYFAQKPPNSFFDVIYLDGLHTFEQTLRDFCNAVSALKPNGIIVIDDILPNSYHAALPDLSTAQRFKAALYPDSPDVSWMGDVYRLVYFIDTFFQSFSYACIKDNHGQMVVWPKMRNVDDITYRRVEDISRTPFESCVLEPNSFRWQNFTDVKQLILDGRL